MHICHLTRLPQRTGHCCSFANQGMGKIPKPILAPLLVWDHPVRTFGKKLWRMASVHTAVPAARRWTQKLKLSLKKTANQLVSLCIRRWIGHQNHSGWGLTVKQSAITIHDDSAANKVTTASVTMEAEVVTHALSGLPQEVTARLHVMQSC